MAMNAGKIVAGGIASGIVMNIMDFIGNGVLFGERLKADANALKPGLGDMMGSMGGKQLAGYVIMDFVIGGLLVWTYAAMRPRFGPGPKAAVMVAIAYWIFGSIVAVNYMASGMMSSGLWLQFGLFYLVSLIIASLVGGAVYKEDSAAG